MFVPGVCCLTGAQPSPIYCNYKINKIKKIISLIAAMDKKRVIGKDNKLPWKLSSDLKRFKKLTSGKPVIMGRKTFESIGKPLSNRINIIITRDKNYRKENCVSVHSADEALEAAKGADEVMVIGGEQVFREFLPKAGKMYLTFIDKNFEGDAYFPEFDENEWEEIKREEYEENGLN